MKYYNEDDHFEQLVEDETETPTSLFHHDLANEFVYQGESRGEILKKLSHILEYTGLIIALKGARGTGKSTLLKQRFLREPKPNWKICFIDAGQNASITELSTLFSRQLGTPALNINDQRSITAFVEHLDNLRESALNTIIIVDNADQLSDQAAEFVIQLAQHEQDIQPLVRLVLSYVEIPQTILRLLPSQNSYEYIKTLEVGTLTYNETEDYIYQALDRAGLEGQGPFSQKLIQQIHRDGRGYIDNIERLAEKQWHKFTHQQQKASSDVKSKKRTRSVLPKIAFALAAALVASLMLFSTPDTDTEFTTELALPDDQESNLLPDPTQSAKIVKRSSLIIRPGEKNALNEQNQQNQQTSVAQPENSPETETTSLPLAATTVTSEVTTNSDVESSNETSANLSQEEWLKKQSTNAFTLQLVGSSNEEAIRDFINKYKIEDKAVYYRSIKNGKPWFAVVYGVYEDNKQALKASRELAAKTSTKPWIRPMASIHQDLGMTAFASQ